jgi:hypothetical protein
MAKDRLINFSCLAHPPGELPDLVGDLLGLVYVLLNFFQGPDGKGFPLVGVAKFTLIPGAVAGDPDQKTLGFARRADGPHLNKGIHALFLFI